MKLFHCSYFFFQLFYTGLQRMDRIYIQYFNGFHLMVLLLVHLFQHKILGNKILYFSVGCSQFFLQFLLQLPVFIEYINKFFGFGRFKLARQHIYLYLIHFQQFLQVTQFSPQLLVFLLKVTYFIHLFKCSDISNIIQCLSLQQWTFILLFLQKNIQNSRMQAYLIVLIVVMLIVLLAINIYLLILYIHPDDKGWGNVVYCKILIVLGLTLCQAQALMVPLDVANRSAILPDAMDMTAFWFFLYIIVLIFICILMPYSIFFYETDEDDGICSRLVKALLYTIGALVISLLILLITWAVFKYVDLPYEEVTLPVSATGTNTITKPTIVQQQIQIETSFVVYVIAILSFFGWIFVILFGGVGLSALPIDLINQFRHRPKPRTSKSMKKTKEKMVAAIDELTKEGDELKELDENNSKNKEAGCFEKYKGNRKVNEKLTEFKAKYYAVSEQFELFNIQLTYADSNPVKPVLKLILGIIFIITSLLWIIQILFGNVVKGFMNDRPLIPLFNELFISLEEGNAGFVSTAVFAYLCLYMLWCVQKGNIKFGIRVPCCCRFHPMKRNETWMNSFLFNVILLSIASVGIIQLCINSFPTYTRNTEIYMIFGVQVNYMRFYQFFYRYNVFPIALLVWTFITLIYMLITCNRKPKYMRKIEKIRERDEVESQND